MPPRKAKAKQEMVASVDSMLMLPFRLHCQKRHPLLRFRSKGEHEADHRLHADQLDHIHVDKEAGTSDDAEAQG